MSSTTAGTAEQVVPALVLCDCALDLLYRERRSEDAGTGDIDEIVGAVEAVRRELASLTR